MPGLNPGDEGGVIPLLAASGPFLRHPEQRQDVVMVVAREGQNQGRDVGCGRKIQPREADSPFQLGKSIVTGVPLLHVQPSRLLLSPLV